MTSITFQKKNHIASAPVVRAGRRLTGVTTGDRQGSQRRIPCPPHTRPAVAQPAGAMANSRSVGHGKKHGVPRGCSAVGISLSCRETPACTFTIDHPIWRPNRQSAWHRQSTSRFTRRNHGGAYTAQQRKFLVRALSIADPFLQCVEFSYIHQ